MKTFTLLCFVALLGVSVALPPPAAPGMPFIPSAAMITAFIPTPEEIAALNALNTTPSPGVVPTPAVGPTLPPTMPPAVANLVAKYKAAAAAFIPATAAPMA